jgi:hypothetical protein
VLDQLGRQMDQRVRIQGQSVLIPLTVVVRTRLNLRQQQRLVIRHWGPIFAIANSLACSNVIMAHQSSVELNCFSKNLGQVHQIGVVSHADNNLLNRKKARFDQWRNSLRKLPHRKSPVSRS